MGCSELKVTSKLCSSPALNSSGSSRRTSARSLDCRCWLLLVLGWDTISSTVLIWVPFTARSPPAGPPKRTQLVGSKLALARHEWEVANHLGESMDTVQELVVSTLNKSDIV